MCACIGRPASVASESRCGFRKSQAAHSSLAVPATHTHIISSTTAVPVLAQEETSYGARGSRSPAATRPFITSTHTAHLFVASTPHRARRRSCRAAAWCHRRRRKAAMQGTLGAKRASTSHASVRAIRDALPAFPKHRAGRGPCARPAAAAASLASHQRRAGASTNQCKRSASSCVSGCQPIVGGKAPDDGRRRGAAHAKKCFGCVAGTGPGVHRRHDGGREGCAQVDTQSVHAASAAAAGRPPHQQGGRPVGSTARAQHGCADQLHCLVQCKASAQPQVHAPPPRCEGAVRGLVIVPAAGPTDSDQKHSAHAAPCSESQQRQRLMRQESTRAAMCDTRQAPQQTDNTTACLSSARRGRASNARARFGLPTSARQHAEKCANMPNTKHRHAPGTRCRCSVRVTRDPDHVTVQHNAVAVE